MRNQRLIKAVGWGSLIFAVVFLGWAWIVSSPAMMLGGFMMNGMMGMMSGYSMPGYGFGHMLTWPVVGSLIGIGVLALVWSVAQPGSAPHAPTQDAVPLDVLKLRFAKGDISREQFEEMQRTLIL